MKHTSQGPAPKEMNLQHPDQKDGNCPDRVKAVVLLSWFVMTATFQTRVLWAFRVCDSNSLGVWFRT